MGVAILLLMFGGLFVAAAGAVNAERAIAFGGFVLFVIGLIFMLHGASESERRDREACETAGGVLVDGACLDTRPIKVGSNG
jgi:Na+/melibiose symporter-like transporter